MGIINCGFVCVPKELVVEEVVGEVELQKQIIMSAMDVFKVPRRYVRTRYIPTRCQQVTNKAYLGDKIGKSDYVDKHVATAIETVTDLRSGL